MPMEVDLLRHPEELSADWLTTVLREAGAVQGDAAVLEFEATAVGTGQMSESPAPKPEPTPGPA
jgi:hypothetical protein